MNAAFFLSRFDVDIPGPYLLSTEPPQRRMWFGHDPSRGEAHEAMTSLEFEARFPFLKLKPGETVKVGVSLNYQILAWGSERFDADPASVSYRPERTLA